MDDMRVEFVMYRNIPITHLHQDIYAYRANGKLPLLQRLCFWILSRLGAQWVEETFKTKRVSFHSDDLMHAISKQRQEVFKMLSREPTTLLIGAQDFEELMHIPDIREHFAFDVRYNKDRRILGLRIEVIPWMRGLVVMP
jgi:hypothetical protein